MAAEIRDHAVAGYFGASGWMLRGNSNLLKQVSCPFTRISS